jgi:hypothetical protein
MKVDGSTVAGATTANKGDLLYGSGDGSNFYLAGVLNVGRPSLATPVRNAVGLT